MSSSSSSRLVYGADDALFGSIEARQGSRPFGRVLDAGTGLHSLRWLATLLRGDKGMTHCVAVTADSAMQSNCQREVQALGVADSFTIIKGNWFPHATDPAPTDLPGLGNALSDDDKFDVILADYLIGAMDGFSPYMQDAMLGKLCRYLKPGGRLYLVGLQPLPDTVNDGDANLLCRVRAVRDACILLAGHRCYREYPLQWMERHVQATTDGQRRLVLMHSSQFPILYSHATALKQINVGRSKLPIIRRRQGGGGGALLADGLAKELQSLDDQIRVATSKRPNGKIELGFDYVLTAEWR